MKYSEIVEPTRRHDRYQDTHPVLATVSVRPIRRNQFQHFVGGMDVARLILHEMVDRRVVARVACVDDEIAEQVGDSNWA